MRRLSALVLALMVALPISSMACSDCSDAEESDGLPSSYFIGDHYSIPEIRNQGNWGICYSFATISTIETYFYEKGIEMDLSELYLAASNYFDDERGALYNPSSNLSFLDGGDCMYALQLLESGYGSALESDVPYSDCSKDYVLPEGIESVLYVTGLTSLDNADDSDYIKHRLMTGQMGAVGFNVVALCPNYNSPDGRTYGTFQYSTGIPNHAVALAGWDDNVPASCFGPDTPGDGAWIIRNSWGTVGGNCGYYLVSYYSSLFGVFFVDSAEIDDGSVNMYLYDYVPGEKTAEADAAANMFVAEGYETIGSVSFESYSGDFDYTVSIYRGCREGDPVSGRLVETVSGHSDHNGMINVELDRPVDLRANERFSVVVDIDCEKPLIGIETTMGIDEKDMYPAYAVSESGQSFICNDGVWTDVSSCGHENVRIKAYTIDNDVSVSPVPVLLAAVIAIGAAAAVTLACIRLKKNGRQ